MRLTLLWRCLREAMVFRTRAAAALSLFGTKWNSLVILLEVVVVVLLGDEYGTEDAAGVGEEDVDEDLDLDGGVDVDGDADGGWIGA